MDEGRALVMPDPGEAADITQHAERVLGCGREGHPFAALALELADEAAALARDERPGAGGRKAGRAQSDDGVLDLSLTAPKETGGPGTGTNPEQLLAVGWGACFQSALEMTAKKMGIDASGTSLDVAIGFGPEGEQAREELALFMSGLDAQATKFVESRQRMRDRLQARQDSQIAPLAQA